MSVFYNDNDPNAARWMVNLIAAGQLPGGTVDDRPVQEITRETLSEYEQCHFFAGIGGWPLALRIAGVREDFPLWTASLPCQPFSCAGKRRGEEDERHLWPFFKELVAEFRPPILFGEQTASKDGRAWLARVRADLEDMGYAVGAADLCAAGAGEAGYQVSFGWIGEDEEEDEAEVCWSEVVPCIVGAPHIRQRLYWGAVSATLIGRNVLDRSRRLPSFVSVDMAHEPKGLCHHDDDKGGRQEAIPPQQDSDVCRTGGDRRPYQPRQARQQEEEPSNCESFGEQPQSKPSIRWRVFGERSMDCKTHGEQETSLAWVFYDEGGSTYGQEESIRGASPTDSVDTDKRISNFGIPRLEGHLGDGDARDESGRVGAPPAGPAPAGRESVGVGDAAERGFGPGCGCCPEGHRKSELPSDDDGAVGGVVNTESLRQKHGVVRGSNEGIASQVSGGCEEIGDRRSTVGVSDSNNEGSPLPSPRVHDERERRDDAPGCGAHVGIPDACCDGRDESPELLRTRQPEPCDICESERMADAGFDGAGQRSGDLPSDESEHAGRCPDCDHASVADGSDHHWSAWTTVRCTDGRTRRVPQSALQCVVDGFPAYLGNMCPEEGFPLAQKGEVPNRTLILKGVGNAIVPELAAMFVEEFMAVVEEMTR